MSKALQEHLPPRLRQKIYLTLAFVSLTLLFYSIWQVKPVIVDVYAPLGLASYFTPYYWLGLALLVLGSVLAFLDKEVKKDALFIVLLIALGLFLWGSGVFAYANPRDPSCYHPTSEVRSLLVEHHLDITAPTPSLTSYESWPATHFISATILEMSGIDIGSMIKYWPLFNMLILVLITYSIGKRLKLTPNRCFLISFLAFSSWHVSMGGGYNPRSFGMMLFLLLLVLLIVPRRTPAEVVVVVLTFSALMLSHGLTTLVLMSGLILLSAYRKETRFIALFIVIFFTWYIYQAYAAMAWGIEQFWAVPFMDIFKLAQAERYQMPSVMARTVTRYSQLSYLALYASLMIGSFILLVRRRIAGEHRKQVIAIFFWLTGVALAVGLSYGAEGPYRAYLFCLVPAAAIIALSFSSKKLIVALMFLSVALFLPANYGVDASYSQVRTTDLKGTEFLALTVKPWHSFYYHADPALVNYHDPEMVWEAAAFGHFGMPDEVDLSFLDTQAQAVCFSKEASAHKIFSGGVAPYDAWPEKTEAGRTADLLYDNGDFQIYWNRVIVPR